MSEFLSQPGSEGPVRARALYSPEIHRRQLERW